MAGRKFTSDFQQVKEEFEDTKGVIRICISKKDRQHNGQKKKYKRTNNDLQSIHLKIKTEFSCDILQAERSIVTSGRSEVSYTNKTDSHDVTEIIMKMALSIYN